MAQLGDKQWLRFRLEVNASGVSMDVDKSFTLTFEAGWGERDHFWGIRPILLDVYWDDAAFRLMR
jgi:hypothetical protein